MKNIHYYLAVPFILVLTLAFSQTAQASNEFWSNVVGSYLANVRYYPKKCDRVYRRPCYQKSGYARRACFKNRRYSSNNYRRYDNYPRYRDDTRYYNNRRYNDDRRYSSRY